MPKDNKPFTITGKQIGTIIFTTVLTTAIGTAFIMLRIVNTDHFTTLSNFSRIEAIEENCVRVDNYRLEIGYIKNELKEISNTLIRLEDKIDKL